MSTQKVAAGMVTRSNHPERTAHFLEDLFYYVTLDCQGCCQQHGVCCDSRDALGNQGDMLSRSFALVAAERYSSKTDVGDRS
eukprot:scaffold888_cov187-Cylindrotheca_fusiformis.AAC.2